MKVSLYNLNMNIQKNISFLGASGSMEKELIHQMFCRSVFKYDVKYTSFIGDGDANPCDRLRLICGAVAPYCETHCGAQLRSDCGVTVHNCTAKVKMCTVTPNYPTAVAQCMSNCSS